MKIDEIMQLNEDLTIGFIGGSITAGDGYRNIVTDYLIDNYPVNNITSINAGLGGTTSFLGTYRLQRDLLCKNPDMVVIEFSVNDSESDDADYYKMFERTTEGIVRQILLQNPKTIIIFIGLTTKTINEKYYDKGIIPYSIQAHKKVADYYNIPFCNAGFEMYEHLKNNEEDISKYTVDGCHTNKFGGELYGNSLIHALNESDWNISFKEKPLNENCIEKGFLNFATPMAKENWHMADCAMNGVTEEYLYSNVPNSELCFDFYGSALGIYCTTEKTSGNIAYSIDGGEWMEKCTWDIYAKSFPRYHYYILEEEIERKHHSVKIKVSENKNDMSEGYYIRIIAFLTELE